MAPLIDHIGIDNVRVMTFVDGENLVIRLQAMVDSGFAIGAQTMFRKDVYAWSPILSRRVVSGGGLLRTHYYTAVQGDHDLVDTVCAELKAAGANAPRVFKKAKGARSKQVDIMLATEMLLHATRRNYDIAVLVAGDADYVPLIEAVQSEGRGVHLWSVPSGLSPRLVQAADEYRDISSYLLAPFEAAPDNSESKQ